MKILIINGPNLNLLGKRETSIYGDQDFGTYLKGLEEKHRGVHIDYFQSNHEGEIIDKLQESDKGYKGIILNAGGLTHTSISIADAIVAISAPVLEVHISNIYAREEFRRKSFLSPVCVGVIAGCGLKGYSLAIQYFLNDKK